MKFSIYILILLLSTNLKAQKYWQEKIDPEVWAEASQKSDFEFFVLLNEQVNTNASKKLTTKEAKALFVFNQLQRIANETQGELLQIIIQHQADYRPFFIVNGIWVKGNVTLLEVLAKRSEVLVIGPNPHIKNDLPQAEHENTTAFRSPNSFEWGIGMIRANLLWDYNIKGSGVVVGGQDTGYEWFHPALKKQYMGDTLDHNYHWHDAIHGKLSPDSINICGFDVKYPCDDGSHGTHTMGIMVGDDDLGNQIGVAPDSRWIGCRNMENGWGSPSTYIECFEWFLAPTDTNNLNPDPTLSPHVIANSWGCPAVEGCNITNFHVMQLAIENLKNAGTFITVSAGNDGWAGCNTIMNPASIYEASFSVGATDILDTLANFSSRGNVTSDSSLRMKPNVVAPGVSVRSCIPGNQYVSYSGTSMAGPHVAGAVALLISASPDLAGNVDSLETLLEMTADTVYTYRDDTCGLTDQLIFPNNMVGFGRVNLLKVMEIIRPDLSINITSISSNNIQIFPNPFSDAIQITTMHPMENCTITLTSSLGQVIRQFDPVLVKNFNLDLGYLPVGVYFITFENKNEKVVSKIVKQ